MPRSILLEDLSREVHIWLTVPLEAGADRLLEMLAPEEVRQYRRYRVERARALYLSGRLLARSVLSRYVEVEPAVWSFRLGEHGRPEILGPSGLPALRFNLSHTDGLVACLVALEADSGVDVEEISRCANPGVVAKHYFSADEATHVQELGGREQRMRFFSYWTLKEAYIKGRGFGNALSSKRFSFDLRQADTVSARFDPSVGDRESDWQFGLWRPSSSHLLAAAIRVGRDGPRRVVVRKTTPLADRFESVELERLASSRS